MQQSSRRRAPHGEHTAHIARSTSMATQAVQTSCCMRRLQSLGLVHFEGGPEANGVYHVQHAVVCALPKPSDVKHVTSSHSLPVCFPDAHHALQAPLRFDRENLTTTLPAQDTATITFNNCSFACPNITKSLPSYATTSRAWGPLELFSALRQEDSCTILLQQSLTTANNSWGPTPLLIAESRSVVLLTPGLDISSLFVPRLMLTCIATSIEYFMWQA